MDNTRLFLYAALVFVGMLLWQQWQVDYGPQPVEDLRSGTAQPDTGDMNANLPQMDDLPDQADNTVTPSAASDIPQLSDESQSQSRIIIVETDVIE